MRVIVSGQAVNEPQQRYIAVESDNLVGDITFVGLPNLSPSQLVTLHWVTTDGVAVGDIEALTPVPEGWKYDITSTLTQCAGRMISAYVQVQADEQVWHSQPFRIGVAKLPGMGAAVTPADPTIIDQMLAAMQAHSAAMDAQEARVEDLVSEADAAYRNIQAQVDELVVDGDSSVEAAQARVTEAARAYPTLKARLDAGDTRILRAGIAAQVKAVRASRGIAASAPAMLTFIDDDGQPGILTKLKPLFTAKGVPCNCAVFTTSHIFDTPEREAELLELQNTYGWEILSHTMTHVHLGSATDAEIVTDCENYLKFMAERGFDVKSIAYPWGERGNTEIISRYFAAGLSTNDTALNDLTTDTYFLHRQSLGVMMSAGKDNLSYFAGLIDDAIANGKWVIFMTHCDYEGNDMQIISDVLDYAVASGIRIVTVDEALRYYGDVIRAGGKTGAGYYRIKADGSIQSDIHTVMYNRALDSSDQSIILPGAYPVGISTRQIGITEVNSFPTYGYVVTIKLASSTSYVKQYFLDAGTNRIYMRRGAAATDEWLAWEQVLTSGYAVTWTGKITMSHSEFKVLGYTKCTNYVDFVKMVSAGGEQPVLSKTLWTAAEISTDSLTPTVIGTAGVGRDVQVYRDASGYVYIKYGINGNNYATYIKTDFC